MLYFGIIVIVGILLLVFLYNGLIAKKNKVEEAESDIDVMLKKRFDLIPNLVETVKAYMKHERDTLVELTELRQASWNEVEEQLSASRRNFNAAVNSYNNGVEQFPTNVMANSMGYQIKEYIEIPEVEKENISAKELFNS